MGNCSTDFFPRRFNEFKSIVPIGVSVNSVTCTDRQVVNPIVPVHCSSRNTRTGRKTHQSITRQILSTSIQLIRPTETCNRVPVAMSLLLNCTLLKFVPQALAGRKALLSACNFKEQRQAPWPKCGPSALAYSSDGGRGVPMVSPLDRYGHAEKRVPPKWWFCHPESLRM